MQYEWWHKGIVYQIYPRSFADSNGDGVGDLRGVIEHLDYLTWLGVDALWLSPIFPSPMADFGYDIADYCDIHPLFGTLAEFDTLLAEAHKRDLKVMLDFVPNHSSDEHAWFKEARASRDNPKRDWYIWRDAAPDGGPPNNWLSNFGGSAWELDAQTNQYYYHAFLKEQPDLNWRNPQLREAMHDVLRFWLDRGVDGFRVDVIWHIVKDDLFRDNPRNPGWVLGQNPHQQYISTYEADRPEVHEVITGMRRVLDEYPHRMMVGEVYLPLDRLMTYYGHSGEGVHMPFNFQLITTAWSASSIVNAVESYEERLPKFGWPNWVLGNHDNARIATRIGDAQARIAAMLLLTLRGTPTVYYGEELGMRNVPIPPALIQDPFEKNVPGIGLGRDPERTPMQWNGGANAGFTRAGVTPWLPLPADFSQLNVEAEKKDPAAMVHLYRALIELRRASEALSVGRYLQVAAREKLLAYLRTDGTQTFLIALNFGDEAQSVDIDLPTNATGGRLHKPAGNVALSTNLDRKGEAVSGAFTLRANEGLIIALT